MEDVDGSKSPTEATTWLCEDGGLTTKVLAGWNPRGGSFSKNAGHGNQCEDSSFGDGGCGGCCQDGGVEDVEAQTELGNVDLCQAIGDGCHTMGGITNASAFQRENIERPESQAE